MIDIIVFCMVIVMVCFVFDNDIGWVCFDRRMDLGRVGCSLN